MALPDKASLSGTYGGPYANSKDVDDPTTDVDAGAGNQFLCDTAMATHTVRRAWVIWTGITYTSGTMVIVPDDHEALWGSGTSVRPLVEQTSAGVYRVTWPTSVNDELAEPHALNVRFPEAPIVYGADGLRAKVISWTANTITVNATSAGALNALNGTKIGQGWS